MKQKGYLGLSPEGFHRLAYTEWGSFSGEMPSIVCVHGLTRNGRDFDALAAYLQAQDRHVLCPDIVGRGESAWFANPLHYNFPQYVSDMSALLSQTNTAPIDWIGTSMGGLIGMMIAAMPNNPIRKLVLNDIGPQIPVKGLRRIRQYTGKAPVFNSIQAAKDYFKKNYADFGSLTDEEWGTLTHHSIKKIESGAYCLKIDPMIARAKSKKQWLSDVLTHPRKALEGVLFDIDLWAIWQQIQCPVLVIHGKQSDLLTAKIILNMQQIKPSLICYEVDDAGHAPALLEPQQHDVITNWLRD